jgi:peptidoglycan L-alanyl-D-glutamate endopeptidase CwlK
MASRSLQDLDERIRPLAYNFTATCKAAGIDLLVTCTLRSLEEQAALYAKGRDVPGPIVTKAKPGSSAHNYGMALDVVPLVGGKPLWEFDARNVHPIWQQVGDIGMKAGLEWFGAPGSPFLEAAHFQMRNWRSYIKP